MLLNGFNHVATLTNDIERMQDFWVSVFDAEVLGEAPGHRKAPVSGS